MTQRQLDGNGWYEVKRNPLSLVGVFPYRGAQCGLTGDDAERTVRVYRPEDELASPECIESFKLIPWVDDHTLLGPNADAGQTPAEQKGVQGVIGEDVFYDSGTLYGNIKVFSNSLARLIEAGKRQLSAGYRCVYDWTAGTFNGQPYDCVQRNIRGNHLALVQAGRMGASVAVMDHFLFTFDAQEAVMADPEKKPEGEGAGAMTLADATTMLQQLAPQVAKLNELVAQIQSGGAAVVPAEADDKKPPVAGAAAPAPAPAAGAAAAPAAATPAAAPAEDKTASAMDAALKPIREQLAGVVATLAKVTTGMDSMGARVVTDIATRDKLAARVSEHVGTFDHADKTLAQVAAYACEKVGLKAAVGSEVTAIEAWMHGRAPASTVRHAADAANTGAGTFVHKFLSGEPAAK